MESRTPYDMRKSGRDVQNYVEMAWDGHRMPIMHSGLRLKYQQNAELRESLLSTGVCPLFEASRNDKIWGIGHSKEQVLSTSNHIDPKEFGRNLLGQALMKVRKELKEGHFGMTDSIPLVKERDAHSEKLLTSHVETVSDISDQSETCHEAIDDCSESSSGDERSLISVIIRSGKKCEDVAVLHTSTYEGSGRVIVGNLPHPHWLRERPQ